MFWIGNQYYRTERPRQVLDLTAFPAPPADGFPFWDLEFGEDQGYFGWSVRLESMAVEAHPGVDLGAFFSRTRSFQSLREETLLCGIKDSSEWHWEVLSKSEFHPTAIFPDQWDEADLPPTAMALYRELLHIEKKFIRSLAVHELASRLDEDTTESINYYLVELPESFAAIRSYRKVLH